MAKTKRKSQQPLEDGKILSPKNVIWGTAIIALFVGIIFLAYRTKATQPNEYEGRIVDKWAGYSHSILGSRPYFKLLVETRSGQRIAISVDQDLYYRVTVGTWIKKTQTGVEVGQKEIRTPSQRNDPLITLRNTNTSFVNFRVIRG